MARDSSVARLFVEYSLLDLPTEETPLSLPKPPQGRNINYNYSKGEAAHHTLPRRHPGMFVEQRIVPWTGRITGGVLTVVPVDAENNSSRRRLLRAVLEGKNPQMER